MLSKLHTLLKQFLSKFARKVHYINGPETLPPPLTSEEEKLLLSKILIHQDEDNARQELIIRNLRLVVYIAKKFENTGIGIEDLISIGTIGLIKAVNTFCPDKNIKLATYASRCIENEISIDEPLNIDWDGNELLLSDVLGTDGDNINKNLEQDVEKNLLLEAVDKLDDREKTIMQMRFGLSDGVERTQKEVADIIGISQSYISRLEKKIIKQLRRDLEKSFNG